MLSPFIQCTTNWAPYQLINSIIKFPFVLIYYWIICFESSLVLKLRRNMGIITLYSIVLVWNAMVTIEMSTFWQHPVFWKLGSNGLPLIFAKAKQSGRVHEFCLGGTELRLVVLANQDCPRIILNGPSSFKTTRKELYMYVNTTFRICTNALRRRY
jgi:hypothetical protein